MTYDVNFLSMKIIFLKCILKRILIRNTKHIFFFSEWLVSLAGNGKSGDGRTYLLQELTFEF